MTLSEIKNQTKSGEIGNCPRCGKPAVLLNNKAIHEMTLFTDQEVINLSMDKKTWRNIRHCFLGEIDRANNA